MRTALDFVERFPVLPRFLLLLNIKVYFVHTNMPATLISTDYTKQIDHQRSLSVPSLSCPPVLSTRGQRALHRPPLLKCSLFENQFADSNPRGFINLGVAENVSFQSNPSEKYQVLLHQLTPLTRFLTEFKSLCIEWLIEFFEKNFKLDYSDFTYGKILQFHLYSRNVPRLTSTRIYLERDRNFTLGI